MFNLKFGSAVSGQQRASLLLMGRASGLRAVLFLRREDYTLQTQDVLLFPSLSKDVDCEIGCVDNLDLTSF